MTVVLRPSVIENQDFLRQEDYPLFLQTVRECVRDKVDTLFSIGHTYSLGSDADMVCFFDGRSSKDILESQRLIADVCKKFRLEHCDIIKFIREPDGNMVGLESIHNVGPLMHLLSRLEGAIEVGAQTIMKEIIQSALDKRMAASTDPFNDEIVAYASHKSTSLIEHVSQPFDPENVDCVKGLGKIFSYAGHAGRQMLRAEIKKEPGDKWQILQWAEGKNTPETQTLASLLREEQVFRFLLRQYADDVSQRGEYERYLRFVYDEVSIRVIDFARNLRRKFS